MSKLKAKDPKAAEPSKPKILIFGKPGVGKTWTSLDFPSVYYIDTENGANLGHYTDKLKKSGGVYMGQEDGSLDFNEVIEQVKALASEKHNYKTLVIDSVSKLYNTAAADAAEKGGDDFGRDKKEANKPMRRLISAIGRLDMNTLLIAHEEPLWGGAGKDRSVIGATFDCFKKLEYELHLALNIQKRGNSRVAVVNKTRLVGFEDQETFPWSYEAFAKKYGKDIMEAPAVPIVLATGEQVAEIKRLVELLKTEPATIQKWLERFNAEAYEDFNQEQATTIITGLTAKLK